MNSEFMDALNILEKERGINKDILIEAVENALISAYKRNYMNATNVRVEIDKETGVVKVYSRKTVVPSVNDEQEEISLEEALQINSAYEEGDIIEQEVTPKAFGRIAAQTAKQVVMQRIREAERGVIFEEYIQKEDELLTAIVQRVDRNGGVYLELGKTEGYMPRQETVRGEHYNVNDRIKVYVVEVKNSPKGPQVFVSRSHPGLVKRLFEMEVPEIQMGIVEIKAIAREAGFRTKIAVASNDPQVDAIGACVGQRGIRIDRVVHELNNEKIDIIKYSSDPVQLVANALSPAKIISVEAFEDERSAYVIVPDNQLSLAIGKEGQNARLAAKLTGWKIDIKSHSSVSLNEGEAEDQDDQDIDIPEETENTEQAVSEIENMDDIFEDISDADIDDIDVDDKE